MEDEQLSPTPKVLGAMAITHSEMERRLRSRKASEKEPLPGSAGARLEPVPAVTACEPPVVGR